MIFDNYPHRGTMEVRADKGKKLQIIASWNGAGSAIPTVINVPQGYFLTIREEPQ